MVKKVRISHLRECKREKEKIVIVTAYDFPTGHLADAAGVDVILVGDSLGNTILGYADTIPVRLEQMVHHTAAVRRGVSRAFLVADMPFMTYKITSEEAMRNAARLVQEGGAEAVKLEGGRIMAPTVRRIVDSGIPVMGHVGLTPQSIHALSGYRVQARGHEAAEQLLEDALSLQEAGCFSVVVECVPWEIGEKVSQALEIPVIGIGAGAGCDGQVLVLTDLLGLSQETPPSFVKPYAQIGRQIKKAIRSFARDVREGSYPDRDHAFFLDNKKERS